MEQGTSSTAGPPAVKGLLGFAGGFFLGAVLLVAAWAKAIHPDAFVEQIRLEGLDFLLSAQAVAFIALGLEVALGVALVLGLRQLWVLLPSSALVAFFLYLTGRNYWLTSQGLRGAEESCGCFGNLVERTPAEAFWQDLLLLVPALLIAFLGWRWGSRRAVGLRVAVVVLVTAAALVLAWRAPELPLDDLATRLKPGTVVEEVCAGPQDDRVCLTTVAPELAEGRHVVILADLEDPDFAQAVPTLNEYVLGNDGGAPTLSVLSSATAQEQRAFFWQSGPSFPIHETPPALLKPLYRRLPRSFTVEDGRVLETFAGLPPLQQPSPSNNG